MSLFARVEKVSEADIFQRKPYFQEGNYKVRVLTVHARDGRNGNSFFVVEAEVLESSNADIMIGGTYAWVQKMNNDAGPGAVKMFIAALVDVDPKSPEFDDINAEFCELIVSDEQPKAGKEMGLQCHMKMIGDNKDKPFTVHTWS